MNVLHYKIDNNYYYLFTLNNFIGLTSTLLMLEGQRQKNLMSDFHRDKYDNLSEELLHSNTCQLVAVVVSDSF